MFGGWPRDTILSQRQITRFGATDIDMVVAGINTQTLREILPSSTETNKFGGFATELTTTRLDVWAIERTYTFRRRGLALNVDALPSTTVFTHESIIFKPAQHWDRPAIVEDRFYETIRHRIIDMQLGEIRYPTYQVGRLLQHAERLNFELSNDAEAFVKATLATSTARRHARDGLMAHGHPRWKFAALTRMDRFCQCAATTGHNDKR